MHAIIMVESYELENICELLDKKTQFWRFDLYEDIFQMCDILNVRQQCGLYCCEY